MIVFVNADYRCQQITTAVAFFGTAICPVAPLKLFAIFNGVLIMFAYFLCVLLVFPALCLFDRWTHRGNNSCIYCHCCHQLEAEGETAEGEEKKPSAIRRILATYYNFLHRGRWVLLVVTVGAIIACGITATNLEPPASSDVRLLDDDHEFEINYKWRRNLLVTVFFVEEGSRGYIVWGVKPADTGDPNNPGMFQCNEHLVLL